MAISDPSLVEPAAERPWYAAYPAPKTTASAITRETLLSWMLEGKVAGKDFVLIDLRRMDHEVCPNVLIHGDHIEEDSKFIHELKC
jgi:arsenical-resistance protein 2